MDTWIIRECKRQNRNLLIVNASVLAVTVALAVGEAQYLINFVRGCEVVPAAQVASLTSATERFRNFVTVTGEKSVATGFQDIEQRVRKGSKEVLSTTVKDEYILLRVEDRLLLVKAPPGPAVLLYSGQLVSTPAEVETRFVAELRRVEPELASAILPFTLDATDYKDKGYWSFGIGIPVLLVVSWNLIKGLRRSSELQGSPMWSQLGCFGNAEQLSMQIDGELASRSEKFGAMTLTEHWMIQKSFFSAWISPMEDLVWAHKKETKHYTNFIPTGKSFAVVVTGRHGQSIEVECKEGDADQFLAHLSQRVPWAIFGYDQKLEEAWKSDPGGFVEYVDRRRTESVKSRAASASS